MRSTRSLILATSLLSIAACAGCKDDVNNDQPDMVTADTTIHDTADMPDLGTDVPVDMGPSQLKIPTLTAPVTVRYDEAGVLHLECSQDRDCLAAEGYFHARDRFVQMDFMRNQTRGRLSTMVGHLVGLDSDRYWRLRTMTREGDPLEVAYLEAASDTTRQNFQAYADGVNAWLNDLRAGRNGAALSAEYSSGLLYELEEIRDWEPADSVTLYLQLASQWAYGSWNSSEFTTLFEPDIAADLMSAPGPVASDMSVFELSNLLRVQPRAEPVPQGWRRRLDPVLPLLQKLERDAESHRSILFGEAGRPASNSWIMGPTKTADGSVLLANDPHLDMTNPSIWYMAEMRAVDGELHVAGASVPGAPGIIIGHNEHIAWSATTALYANADVYVETLAPDGNAVMRDGQRVEILRKEHTYQGRFGAEAAVTLEWVPGHGPIVAKDDVNALTVKWVGAVPDRDIDFLTDLMYAKSVEEADQALDVIRVLNVNWLVGDRDGNIAWFPKAQLPDRRPWSSAEFPIYLPLPGDGTTEWSGLLDSDDLYRLENPPAGFIVNTNNDMDDSWQDGNPSNDGRPPVQTRVSSSNNLRHQRAIELLSASDEHTLDTIGAAQADLKSAYAALLLPVVLAEMPTASNRLSANAANVYAALESWNYNCPTGLDGPDPALAGQSADAQEVTDSIGCAAFHVFLKSLTIELVDDELTSGSEYSAEARWKRYESIAVSLFVAPATLVYGEGWVDNVKTAGVVETREDLLVATFERAAASLASEFGSTDPQDWLWGRIHFARLPGLLPLDSFRGRAVATPGGLYTLAKADPGQGSYDHVAGQSARMLYRLSSTGVEGYFQYPGGQVHKTESPLYDNLVDEWLSFTPTRLPFTPEEVAAAPLFETLVVEN